MVVKGVGAALLPMPPTGTVYHNKLDPVAVNALATAPWQKLIGVDTRGALGALLIITSICILALSQPFIV